MEKRLLIISPFPPKGAIHNSRYSALASFGKNKVSAIQKISPQTKITILADKIPEDNSWEDKNLMVKRVWKRNDLCAYLALIREVLKEPEAKKVLIELEWALFGKNPLLLIPFPFFVFLLRLFKKEVFVVCHGVLLDFSLLSPQLGLERKGLKSKIYNLGLKLFYQFLVLTANKVIVLEEHFAKTLNRKFKTNKVVCIPHGVDTKLQEISPQVARKQLGISKDKFILLNFGFLSWYKGTDLLAKIFLELTKNKTQKDWLLIFAGGESYTHKERPAYKSFMTKIKKLAKKTEKIKITGFVPEEKIPLYFAATNVVIFPHRVFISSSGPLSLAFFFKKPILLSQRLVDYFETKDMRESLKEAGLKKEEILFALNSEGLAKKLTWVKRKENLKRLAYFSTLMRKKRNWERVGEEYL